MRKINFLLLFMATVLFANAQTFFTEDFSSGALPSGWQNIDSASSGNIWLFNNPGGQTINTTTNANGFAIFDSDYYGGGPDDADLVTPIIDCSTHSTVVLKFEHYFYAGWGGAAEVFVSGDNGATWTSLAAWSATSTANAELAEYDISAVAANQSQVLIRWKWTGDYSWYWAVDDVSLYEPVPNDLGVVNVQVPLSSCGMSLDTIKMTIVNFGDSSQTSYQGSYSIDGGTTWSTPENISVTLLSSDTLLYTFTTVADFSTLGTYNVMGTVFLSTDQDPTNDTIASVNPVVNQPIISTYPYVQDFEGTQYWYSGGVGSTWALGTPAGLVINSASSGSNAWVTNLIGDYTTDENSYVESPCFDFSTLNNPLVQFNYWLDAESYYDGARLDYSVDGGDTWNIVGSIGDWTNWYNTSFINGLSSDGWSGDGSLGSNDWVTAKHLLHNLAGQPSVKFRIVFGSDFMVQYEGFAFDDFTIREGEVNMVITEISYNGPESGTDSTEFIEWFNYGQDAVNVDSFYYTAGVVQTLPNTEILPGQFFISAVDSLVMANTFGYTGAFQWTSGALLNTGENIILYTAWGTMVDSVFYDDTNGWPTAADGTGPSLVFCEQNIGSDQNDPVNWNVSTNYVDTIVGGIPFYASPGMLDSVCLSWDVTIANISNNDTIHDCNLTAAEIVMVELTNLGNQIIPSGDTIFGWYQLNADPIVGDTMVLNSDFNPGDTIVFIFSQTVDLSGLGYYSASIWFNYFMDAENMNDTVNFVIDHYEATVNLGPDTICIIQPDTIVLDAGAGFGTYLWQDSSTVQTFNVSTYGTYYVQVTDTNGCDATDTIVVEICVGIEENLLSDVSIYPNPNNGQFVIELPNTIDNVQIEIVTISGQVAYLKQSFNTYNTIDLSKFEKGIYFIKLSNNKEVANYKVVVQ